MKYLFIELFPRAALPLQVASMRVGGPEKANKTQFHIELTALPFDTAIYQPVMETMQSQSCLNIDIVKVKII